MGPHGSFHAFSSPIPSVARVAADPLIKEREKYPPLNSREGAAINDAFPAGEMSSKRPARSPSPSPAVAGRPLVFFADD